jgi:ribonuclease E
VPLLQRHQVESQIDAIHSPVVQLKSGGYIVINQAEALVAIDVNSGRATKERNIEETALKTNCEAADEIARQLRLRDLAGLVVIDFIDMEEHRNQVTVERRLKEALKYDRARIQVGRISPFGLLEMSRQRLRPSIMEASTQPCPHCGGTGHIRSTESTVLHVLRAIEEEGMRRRSAEISVAVPTNVALYLLNQKRAMLAEAEHRYHFRVTITRDDTLIPPNLRLERVRALSAEELAALPPIVTQAPTYVEDEDEDEAEEATAEEAEAPVEEAALPAGEPVYEREPRPEGEDVRGGRRRRRRRRRRKDGEEPRVSHPHAPEPREERAFSEAHELVAEEVAAGEAIDETEEPVGAAPGIALPGGEGDGQQRKRRRRGRRGGRRRRRGGGPGELPGSQRGPMAAEGGGGDYGHGPQPETPPPHAWSSEREPEPWSVRTEAPARAEESASRPEPAPEPTPAPEPPVVQAHEIQPAERPTEPPQSEGGTAPPPVTITERPANPKRGWWHRLTQS